MSEPLPFNPDALPNVSRDAVMYGNDTTGETIVFTVSRPKRGRPTITVMRVRYPSPDYPAVPGRECSEVLLRTPSQSIAKQYMDLNIRAKSKGQFHKLVRKYAFGAPMTQELTDEKLPNPQEYTHTSWGDGHGHGREPDLESDHPFTGSI